MNSSIYDTLSDTDLIEGSLQKNRRVQEMLYKKYASKMYSICLRYSKSSVDAEDILQEGFMKVFTNLSQFRHDGSFEGWMKRVFINTAVSHFRTKHKKNVFKEIVNDDLIDNSLSILDTYSAKEIIKTIQNLSPGYREVFNLYVIEGYSHAEIGKLLDISEGTSKSQLARAKMKLQKIISATNNFN